MSDIRAYFTTLSNPVFCVCSTGDAYLCDVLWKLGSESYGDLAIRICRGAKMRHVDGLFQEFAAALQFPYYFGENWPALDECLRDLSWLPAKAYLLCITSADQLLVEDSPDSFEILTKVLRKAAKEWVEGSPNHALDRRSETPFHVLMQVPKESEERFLDRLGSMGERPMLVDWRGI
jgi:RNAse (barnase) inhibitor barstar